MTLPCDEVVPLLPALAGGELEDAVAAEVSRHAAGCAACGQAFSELAATVGLLRRAGAVALPAGFEAELHRRLVASGPPPPAGALRAVWERFEAWMGRHPLGLAAGAAAFSAAFAILGTTLVFEQRRPRPDLSAIADTQARFQVPEQKVALVKIDFVSEKAIDDVNFEILLPDGLRFFSGGQALAARSFQWQGKLTSGSNLVPIAVKGSRPGRFHVIAHATGPGLDVSQDVLLEVTT